MLRAYWYIIFFLCSNDTRQSIIDPLKLRKSLVFAYIYIYIYIYHIYIYIYMYIYSIEASLSLGQCWLTLYDVTFRSSICCFQRNYVVWNFDHSIFLWSNPSTFKMNNVSKKYFILYQQFHFNFAKTLIWGKFYGHATSQLTHSGLVLTVGGGLPISSEPITVSQASEPAHSHRITNM